MPGHGSSETPPEELVAVRGERTDLLVLIESFRRECNSNFRGIREEAAHANRDTQARLAGIEGRLSEGSSQISKHDMQLAAVISETAEHHRRIEKMEREGGSGLVARIAALEGSVGTIQTANGKAQAVADAAAQSPIKKFVGSLIDGAGKALGPIIVGYILYQFASYLHAPGSAPTPAPTQAGAHP